MQGNDKLLSKIAKSMKEKFDKYWGRVENINKILLIAIVLDPRYCSKTVLFCFIILCCFVLTVL